MRTVTLSGEIAGSVAPGFDPVEHDIRLIEFASHRVRLPGLKQPITQDSLINPVLMASMPAAQPQDADPRAIDTYHPPTDCWLCGLSDDAPLDAAALATLPNVRRVEPPFQWPQAVGVGFELQADSRHLGPEDGASGHDGAGGSVHGAWPKHRLGFSYAMNALRDDEDVDPVAAALLTSLHACLT